MEIKYQRYLKINPSFILYNLHAIKFSSFFLFINHSKSGITKKKILKIYLVNKDALC